MSKRKAKPNRPTPDPRAAAEQGKSARMAAPEPAAPAARSAKRAFYAGALVSFLGPLFLYISTMEPSSPFWDSGEFIASAYTLGIPHAPCTPLYVLVGRVFTLLPLPLSIAARVNLISALTGALGILFAYLLIVRFLDATLGRSRTSLDTLIKIAGGLVGALFLAFSQTYWTNAIEAEVYALSALFMGLVTWLALKWAENPISGKATGYIYLLFYLLALSIGFHLGTVLVFAGVFFLVLMTARKTFTNLEFILACGGLAIFMLDATIYRSGTTTLVLLAVFVALLAWYTASKKSVFPLVCTGLFVLGISVHLFLLIRAGQNPTINEGAPDNWRALYFALRREQYPPTNVLIRKASFIFQLEHFNGYFQQQFEMAVAYLGRLNIGSLVPIALGIWGMVDHYTKHKKTFVMLFAMLLVTSLGLIVFLNFSDSEVRERDYFYSPAFYFFALFIGIGAASVLNEIKNWASRRKLAGALPVLVPAAVLVALPFFTLAQHHFTHDRSNNYICSKYARNMLVGLEPNAILFTNGDNDTFPLWYIQEVEKYRTDVRVVNLSLLNTSWYIKQLRDIEPKVTITWSDKQISQLRPIQTDDGWVEVYELGVQHILKNNNRSRPIYFGVTVPREKFEIYREFLEMVGMAYKLVPENGQNMVDLAKVEQNIWHEFDYGGILDDNWKRDDSLYREDYVTRVIQNYAAAFATLAFHKGRAGDYEGAVKNLEGALEITPDLDAALIWLGWYKLEAGDSTGALNYYHRQITRHPERTELIYRLAGVYERIGRPDSALVAIDELLRRDPNRRDAVLTGVGMALRYGFNQSAERYLAGWLARHPNDAEIRDALEELRSEGQSAAPDTVGLDNSGGRGP
ncbi:MAG: DUF2723 domain-containing protein [bacterium]